MTYVRINATVENNLYRVLTDAELGRTGRYGLPMVYYFEETATPINQRWQEYLIYSNPGMQLQYISKLLDNGLAFCNKTGLNDLDTPRRDYILGKDLNAVDAEGKPEYPKFSKVFTCGGEIVEMINGVVTLMDGNKDPNFNITPRTHPHLFFAAKTTGDDGYPHPFPNGALYDWYEGGKVPVSFLPHVRSGGSFLFNPTQIQANTARLVKI